MNDQDIFRTHPDNMTILSQTGYIKASTPRSLMPPTAPEYQFTPDKIFKKRIKRDASLFSNFKDGTFWDDQRRRTIATTNTQDVEDVLESDHSPTSPEEISLFHGK